MIKLAVILAAGCGRRIGADTPKQFLKVAGAPILEHTLRAFQYSPEIDQIYIVANAEYINEVKLICDNAHITKLQGVIPGGAERRDSAVRAVRHLSSLPDDSIILFHDAARPLVSQRIISDCLYALLSNDAVAAGIPSSDTLWEVNANRQIVNIPPRINFFRAQTPQGFRLGLIRNAYSRAAEDPDFEATDDCGVVAKYAPESIIAVVDGDPDNIKVTFPADLDFVESRLMANTSFNPFNP